MIYTYLDMNKLCYSANVLRFAYNSTIIPVMALRLSCIVEMMPCFCPQVNMRIWTPHHIKENYSYYTLNTKKQFNQQAHHLELTRMVQAILLYM